MEHLDRPTDLWWFLPDRKKPEHKGLSEEEPEGHEVYFVIPWLGFFRRFKTSFIPRPVISQSHPGESLPMQHTGNTRSLSTRNSGIEPNLALAGSRDT